MASLEDGLHPWNFNRDRLAFSIFITFYDIEQAHATGGNHSMRFQDGGITCKNEILEDWKMNCIPDNIVNMTVDDYEEFLEERRYIMAQKIKRYFAVL